eukprot:gene15832-64529_t
MPALPCVAAAPLPVLAMVAALDSGTCARYPSGNVTHVPAWSAVAHVAALHALRIRAEASS